MSCVWEALSLLYGVAAWAALMSWVEAAAAFLAADSNFLINFLFMALAAAAFVAERSSSAALLRPRCCSASWGLLAHPWNNGMTRYTQAYLPKTSIMVGETVHHAKWFWPKRSTDKSEEITSNYGIPLRPRWTIITKRWRAAAAGRLLELVFMVGGCGNIYGWRWKTMMNEREKYGGRVVVGRRERNGASEVEL